MRVVIAALIFVGGMALICGFVAAGAHFLDGRAVGRKARKKQLDVLVRRLDEIEGYARDTLTVNPGDVTAQQIFAQTKGARDEAQ